MLTQILYSEQLQLFIDATPVTGFHLSCLSVGGSAKSPLAPSNQLQVITVLLHCADVLGERIGQGNFMDQEKRFITEIVQGSVRMAGRIDWELSQVFNGKMSDLKLHYLILLRIGVYQIRYMDSVPDYAAVTTTVQLAKGIHENLGGLTNALLRSLLKRDMPELPDEHSSIDYTSQYYSHPEWMIDKWITEGSFDDAIALANWNNKAPQIWFRVNKITYTATKFKNYLKKELNI